MNKYNISLSRNGTNATVFAGYDSDGFLEEIKIQTRGLRPEQLSYMIGLVAVDEFDVKSKVSMLPFVKVEQVPTDLSFNAFWEKYAYKVGRKERTMKLWAGMNDLDRIKCLNSIPAYNYYLTTKPSMERLYPETYLNQRRYESQFK
jgi:hypothetical protein